MNKMYLLSFLIIAILLTGACRSSPNRGAERAERTRAEDAPVEQPVTQIEIASVPEQPVTIYEPDPLPMPSLPPSVVDESAYTRLQSGIITDGATVYTVRRGDTLSSIARQLYQDGSLYPLIMMASSVVLDPDRLVPEMRLTIPSLRTNMDDPAARESINRYFLQIAQIEEQRGRHGTATLIRNHTR
jgi:hypothetical protein